MSIRERIAVDFYGLARNLAIFATVLLALCVTLSAVEILTFLKHAILPLLFATVFSWGFFYLAWYWGRPLTIFSIVTAQGSGGDLIQKATAGSLRRVDPGVDSAAAEGAFKLGERHLNASRFTAAAQQFEQSVDAAPTLAAHLNLGLARLILADIKGAEDVLRGGFQRALKAESREFQAAFSANLGIVELRKGDLERATSHYEEALAGFRGLGDERGAADMLLNMGNVAAQKGNVELADRTYGSALAMFQKLGSRLGRANAIGGIANLRASQDKLDEAMKLHLTALEIHDEAENQLGRASARTNLGNVYFRQDRLEQSLAEYQAAHNLHLNLGDLIGVANALSNMGNIYFKEGQREEALSAYDQALEQHDRVGNLLGRAHVLTNIGSLLAREKRTAEALESLGQAKQIYLEIGSKSRGLAAAEQLIDRLEGGQPTRRGRAAENPPEKGNQTGEETSNDS